MEILVLQDNTVQLQDNLPDRVKELILTDNEGSHFEKVDSWEETLAYPIWNGSEVVNDDVKEAKEAQAKKLADVKTFIEGYIQAPIDAYNLANGVDFANAHSCADYKDIDGYTHQQFCIDIWAFNVAVWEKARQVQIDVTAGTMPEPTMEEFVAMLPVWQS